MTRRMMIALVMITFGAILLVEAMAGIVADGSTRNFGNVILLSLGFFGLVAGVRISRETGLLKSLKEDDSKNGISPLQAASLAICTSVFGCVQVAYGLIAVGQSGLTPIATTKLAIGGIAILYAVRKMRQSGIIEKD
ncbi:hypothetical protein K0504_09930 [Neiella marina]|uniref:Uncharacterized protein n=1 Tax=Neiella holothuriorum TaxID=2870530 RepID=A0ABS7EG93_9GAMM|nr:hypothetical protein [Neiella holothuriorum]MBW8191356.1 hypothetical protein [Neiella holothuriorum]